MTAYRDSLMNSDRRYRHQQVVAILSFMPIDIEQESFDNMMFAIYSALDAGEFSAEQLCSMLDAAYGAITLNFMPMLRTMAVAELAATLERLDMTRVQVMHMKRLIQHTRRSSV